MDLDTICTVAWFTPTSCGWSVPLLFTGASGATKTAQNYAMARKFCSPFLHLSPGQKGDGYFGVIPVPVVEDGKTILHFPSNRAVERLVRVGRGLICVDEVRSAPGIVRPSLLGLLQEREFGDALLPPGVRVWGLSNPSEEAVNGRPLSAPEANRLCHIPWHDPTPRQMRAYAVSSSAESPFAQREEGSMDYEAWAQVEAQVLADRPRLRPAAADLVFTFCERKVHEKTGAPLLRDQPKAGSPASDSGWASPRSWMNVVDVLYAYRSLVGQRVIARPDGVTKDSDDPNLAALVRGLVGARGDEFLVWADAQDLPDFADWLDGRSPVDFGPPGLRDDRTYAIFSGAATFLMSSPPSEDRKRRAGAFWRHAKDVADKAGFELVMGGGTLLIDAGVEQSSKEAHAFYTSFTGRIQAARRA